MSEGSDEFVLSPETFDKALEIRRKKIREKVWLFLKSSNFFKNDLFSLLKSVQEKDNIPEK